MSILALPMAALLAADAAVAARYLDQVARWRAGAETPLVEWSELSTAQIEDTAQDVASAEGCDAACLRAAALMHTELGFYFLERDDMAGRQAHFRAAERLMGRARGASPPDEFERRWRLARAYQLLHLTAFEEMLDVLQASEATWGPHPELLVARGTLYELLYVHRPPVSMVPAEGSGAGVRVLRRRATPRHPVDDLEDAKRAYALALARDPRHAEAHIRYGRVLRLGGKKDKALASVERGLALGPPREIAAVAHLILGEIAESRARLDDAVSSYRRAGEMDPHLQSARLALSHAFHRAGRRDESLKLLREALPTVGGTERVDTWAGYQTGMALGYRQRMNALRAELR